MDEVKNRLVLGKLNFGERQIRPVISEVFIIRVQYPKAESGEATFVLPIINAKIGSKLFLIEAQISPSINQKKNALIHRILTT